MAKRKSSSLRLIAACCCLIIGSVAGYCIPTNQPPIPQTTETSSSVPVSKEPAALSVLKPNEPYNQRAFNPNDDNKGCAALIIEKINEAQNRIYFALYSFRHKKIGDALIAAIQRGVKVRGLIDYDEYKKGRAPQADRLIEAGATIQFDAQSGKGHDKYTVIDENTTLFGSFNYDDGPSEKSFNNVFCRGNDAKTANTYLGDWLIKRRKADLHMRKKKAKEKKKKEQQPN